MGFRTFLKNLLVGEPAPIVQQDFVRRNVGSDVDVWKAIEDARAAGAVFSEWQLAKLVEFLRARQIMEESMELARTTKNELTKRGRLEDARRELVHMQELVEIEDLPISFSNPEEIWAEYYELSGMAPDESLALHETDQLDWVFKEEPVNLSAFIGKPWGEIVAELTGGVNLVDGKQTWELADELKHDLPKMLECCHAELKTLEQAGQIPAPYYFERAAILLRKQKQYVKEVKICELYLDAVKAWNQAHNNSRPNGPGARHDKILKRLPKARDLAATQALKKLQAIEDSAQ